MNTTKKSIVPVDSRGAGSRRRELGLYWSRSERPVRLAAGMNDRNQMCVAEAASLSSKEPRSLPKGRVLYNAQGQVIVIFDNLP